jgi:rhodanese-related sulfurtransferase
MSRIHTKSRNRPSKRTAQRHHKSRKRNLNWLWVSLGVLLLVVVGMLLLNSNASFSPEITAAQAYAKYQQGAFFLDVRNQEEWDQYHIAESTLIPLNQLKDRVTELPKDKDIVVVCRSGRRSQSGASILQKAGFTNVSSLSGGLNAWTAANYPVEGNVP